MTRFMARTRWGAVVCLFVLGIISAAIVLPYRFITQAATRKGLFTRTESADPALPNFDIRDEKGETVAKGVPMLKYYNSVAYIQSWLVALKNDTNLFTSSSQLAQKATDYILGEVISNQPDDCLELAEVV